jgi:hypothetical protein
MGKEGEEKMTVKIRKDKLEALYKQGSTLRLLIIQCQDKEIEAEMQIAQLRKQIRDIESSIYNVVEKKQHAQKAIIELFK